MIRDADASSAAELKRLSRLLVTDAMVAMNEKSEVIAMTCIRGVEEASDLAVVLCFSLRKRFEKVAEAVAEKLVRKGSNAFWSALSIMQEKEVVSGWSSKKYEQTYTFFIKALEKGSELALVNDEEKEKCFQALAFMIEQSQNEQAKRLLSQRHIQDLVNFDLLLVKAIDSKNEEMSCFLIGMRTDCLASAIVQLQSKKTVWTKSAYVRTYQRLIEVLKDRLGTLAAYRERIPPAFSDGEGDVSEEAVEEYRNLKLTETERKALLKVLNGMVSCFDNIEVRDLLGEKKVVETLALLDSETVRTEVGFDDLILQALRVGNGTMACFLALKVSAGESLISAVRLMQSFKTTYFWTTGSYEATYNFVLRRLLSVDLEFRSDEERDVSKTREVFSVVLACMLAGKEDKSVSDFLAAKHLEKYVSKDTVLVESIKAKNFTVVMSLSSQERENLPAAMIEMNLINTFSTHAFHKLEHKEAYQKILDCFLEKHKDKNSLLNSQERKDLLSALEYWITCGGEGNWKVFFDLRHIVAQLELGPLVLCAVKARNGNAVFSLRWVQEHNDAVNIPIEFFVRAIVIMQAQSPKEWRDNAGEYDYQRSYYRLKEIFKSIMRMDAPLVLSDGGRRELALMMSHLIQEVKKPDSSGEGEIIAILKEPKILALLEDNFKKLLREIAEAKKINIFKEIVAYYKEDKSDVVPSFFGELQLLFSESIEQGDDPCFNVLLVACPDRLSLLGKGNNAPLVESIACGRQEMTKKLLLLKDFEQDYSSAFLKSINKGDEATFDILLTEYPDKLLLDSKADRGDSPLVLAVKCGHSSMAGKMVALECDQDYKTALELSEAVRARNAKRWSVVYSGEPEISQEVHDMLVDKAAVQARHQRRFY